MDAPSTTPHDAVFKQFLMHAETARDFLEIHLPVELRELCDLNTLHLESGSFIEESLKGHSTDVLYSVQMQGNPGYLHVVIEHQSKPDKKMAFRMMRYSIAAMHRHLEADHDKLPLVVPILFYQGEATPYPLSMCWFDIFYSPELARRVYNSPFPLVDITITPDDEIMQHRRIAILELLQKHGFAPIFPDICYHLTHYKPAAADIPVASDNPAHYADAIRYNARTPLQGSLLPLTRLVWA